MSAADGAGDSDGSAATESFRTIKANDLCSSFFPELRGRVFHVTSRARWDRIASAGAVSANADGVHGESAPQSRGSIGRQNGFVCLFDLRDVTAEEIREWVPCFQFPREGDRNGLSFLMVSPDRYSQILRWADLPAHIDRMAMHIPHVESWWPGALPLEAVGAVIHVDFIPPDLTELSPMAREFLEALMRPRD